MSHYLYEVLRWMDHFNSQQWMIVALVAAVFCLFCMRGFGSRSGY